MNDDKKKLLMQLSMMVFSIGTSLMSRWIMTKSVEDAVNKKIKEVEEMR